MTQPGLLAITMNNATEIAANMPAEPAEQVMMFGSVVLLTVNVLGPTCSGQLASAWGGLG